MSEEDRERWNARYREETDRGFAPDPWLVGVAARWPELFAPGRRALDLAGGNGRHALWLAEQGMRATLLDVAEEGLSRAATEAARRRLEIEGIRHDLDGGLPPGRFDLVVVFHFMDREVYRALQGALAPGGALVISHPTRRNLERHPRPPLRFLLAEGELPGLIEGLAVLESGEGWGAEGRHEAHLVARAR